MTGSDDFEFEVFTRKASHTEGPHVTIRRTVMTLNELAWQLVGSPTSVVLMYDHQRQTIGLAGANHDDADAYSAWSIGDSTTRAVSIRAFAAYYSIDTSVSRRFKARLNGGVLCIDLRKPGQVVSRRETAS